ncbi:MAG: ATP-binding protein, partial [Pseudomonadales bacterium]
SPDNLFIIEVRNGNFHLMWANKVCEQVIGQTTSQFAGKTTRKILGKSGGARVECNYQRCLSAKAPIEYEEESTVEGEHRPRRWHTLLVPKVKDNGEIDFIYGFSREINNLSALLFDTFSQKASDNVFILRVYNKNFYVHWINNALERVIGKLSEEIQGKTAVEFLGETGREREENYRQCVITGEITSYEESFVNHQGIEQFWHTQLMPIMTNHKEVDYILGYSRDITSVKVLQQQSIEANAAKSQLLANVGHEIGNLLNGIMGGAELLEMEPLSERQRNALSLINNGATLLKRFTQDIFDYSRLEIGKLSYHPAHFIVGDLVEQLISSMAPIAAEQDIQLSYTVDRTLALSQLLGDSDRLQQVLSNLLHNGIKYTEAGGQVALDIVATRTNGDTEVTFAVSDTGLGIAPENLDNLFKPFSRLAETAHIRGTGLGLAICHDLVEMMGGAITVNSQLGEGSRFVVKIPFAQTEVIQATAAAKVLLVENNPVDSRIVKEGLEILDIHVTIAINGKTAVAHGLQVFDLIIMDIQLPDMDGIAVTQKLRKLGVHTPIIAYTANATPECRQACLTAGMNEFICKPIQQRHFITRVLHWLSVNDALKA